MSNADEIVKRFEARRAGQLPEMEAIQAERLIEAAAASVAGAQPEEIKLPAQIARGIVLFELEDGTFGCQPLPGSEDMTSNESMTFCHRHVAQTIIGQAVKTTLSHLDSVAQARKVGAMGGILRSLQGGR